MTRNQKTALRLMFGGLALAVASVPLSWVPTFIPSAEALLRTVSLLACMGGLTLAIIGFFVAAWYFLLR